MLSSKAIHKTAHGRSLPRRVLHRAWQLLATLLMLLLLLINARLYHLPAEQYSQQQLGPDVLPQLRFLRGTLDDGAGSAMQQLFPEGFFFSYALYGLSWVEVGLRQPAGSAQRAEALREARWALGQLDQPEARMPFSPALKPPLGIFYVGWSSWLRGGTLLLEAQGQRDQALWSRFEADCAALALAFERRETPFLDAYPGQAWPVDSVVAIAALRLHDQLDAPRYAATIDSWLAAARARLDQATGLLPHRVDALSGRPLEGARGSSQSIIARFLPEVDAGWAAEQYALYRQQFVALPLGLPGIREYPHGVTGSGDVDSGPLVFGISASSTVVTLGAALANGDQQLSTSMLHMTEALGLPLSIGEGKRYAFGLLPVGDAFLVWAKTARRWTGSQPAAQLPPLVPWWWRLPLHAISLLLILLLWLPLWWRRRGRPAQDASRI